MLANMKDYVKEYQAQSDHIRCRSHNKQLQAQITALHDN